MNHDIDETIWQKLSAAFFGAQKTTDERLFTSRVMAEIRSRQPAVELASLASSLAGRQPDARPWHAFTRWAIPALALSMGGFTLATVYSLKITAVSAETFILGDQDSDLSDDWLAGNSTEEDTTPQQEAIG